MRKFQLIMAGLACFATAGAQTILSENFETGNTGSSPQPVTTGQGWTIVNSYTGSVTEFNWHNAYHDPSVPNGGALEGSNCARVTAPRYDGEKGEGEGEGPREEILLSPEITLDDTYQLEFMWNVSPVNRYDDQRYDLQVRIVTDDNLAGAETVFSIQNEKMLRESGVMVFPIEGWEHYTSRIDLSDFKNEKVKIAFVYKMLAKLGNEACVDAVKVSKFTPPTTPVASLSLERIGFGDVYVGQKLYSDIISLTNTGKDGLVITGVDLPEGVSLTFDPANVNLDTYKSIDFRLAYTASLASATQGDVVFHTNGGDKKISFTAQKKFVPSGMTLETFEEYFPPAGWKNSGWGRSSYMTIEGDWSAFCDGGYSKSILTSPRLDLSEGGNLAFRYYAYFTSDDPEAAPEYDVTVELSTDGGDTWNTVWTADWQHMNELTDIEIPLGKGTGNDYVRWIYPIVETTDYGAAEHYTFYMDLVMLPNIVGAEGTPKACTDPVPADGTENIIPQDICLKWAPAQFATGYRLYVGSNDAANNLINGIDLGNKREYTIASCDHETTYRWKVVPYNDKGDCRNVPVWSFTTQPDAAVTTYPYEENFSDGFPTGWVNTPSSDIYARIWEINSYFPYVYDNKKYNVLYTPWLDAGLENAVTTPEFRLPEGSASSISFIWGDEHPSSLVIDPTGLGPKNNVEPNNGVGITHFEIFVDGEWKELSYLSEDYYDTSLKKKYWVNESIDLSEYQGKTVKFRWRNESFSSKHNGASLTHIIVDAKNDNKASFNLSSWEAGKVNYEKSVRSGEIYTLINNGVADQKIAKVETSTPNFSASLAEGDEIPSGSVKAFEISFSAGTSASGASPVRVDDMLIVTLESGLVLRLPVGGTALPESTRYFSFEPEENELDWEKHFTTIDADNSVSYQFNGGGMYYPLGNRRGAFCVGYDGEEDGLWGIMKPVSGMHALVAPSPQESRADNWLISERIKATADSRFEFYARNWDCLGTVEPDAQHIVTVLVSTEGNDKTDSFRTVRAAEMIPLLEGDSWQLYDVDLSEYEGRDIYVAIRHTTDVPSNVAFFDDLTFTAVEKADSGIDCIGSISADTEAEIFSIAGVKVAEGNARLIISSLDKGLYIVRLSDGRTLRIAK